MNIVNKIEKKEISEIEIGGTFLYRGILHMKVEEGYFVPRLDKPERFAVLDLERNVLCGFDKDEKVQPVEAEIRVL